MYQNSLKRLQNEIEIFPEKIDGNFVAYNVFLNGRFCGKELVSFNAAESTVYLIEIFIDLGFRGVGINVMRRLIFLCKSLGYKKIKLLVDFDNERAQNFYRRWGFVFLDRIYDYCYKMELSLN